MNPEISVIMPVYNCEKYLRDSIESILNQTFGNFEFIIINDGSTDKSLKIITSYKDKRIKIINNDKNRGVSFCMNYGIKTALGRFIARMDADDISIKNRFDVQVKFLKENENIDICGSWSELLDRRRILWRCPVKDKDIKSNLFFNSPIINSSCMIRKNAFEKHGLFYDVDYFHAEDYDFWIRAADNFSFHNIPEILIRYRINEESLRRKESGNYKRLLEKIYINNFNKIGLKLNDEEKIIIDFFIDNNLKVCLNDIIIIKKMLVEIVLKNRTLKLYPVREFNDAVGYYWYLLIKNNLKYQSFNCFVSKLLFFSLRSIIKRIALKIKYFNV